MEPTADQKPKVLMTASVASMIDLFNMDNIGILQSMGYEVHVAANFQFGNIVSQERVDQFKAELTAREIKVYDVPIPRSIFALEKIVTSIRMFRQIYAENQYRFVHCHSPIGGVLARLCARKKRKNHEIKIIYTAHGFHFYKGAPLGYWLLYFPIEWYCSFFTDILITINQEDFRFAKKHLHAKETHYVQGVGVDLSRFFPDTSNRDATRKELGIPSDFFTAITVGELNANKNQRIIIRAISAIKKDMHYILVGEGKKQRKLQRLAVRLGIGDRVHFLGYRQDVASCYHCADLLCFPSFREGLSLSLMEAMASGLPVLCSHIRGNRDLVINGKGGYLYAPGDIHGFCEGLKTLIDDSSLCENFGVFNAERVREFSSEAVGRKMRALYSTAESSGKSR